MNPLKEACPNCESAWTGGHPDPGSRDWCVICSDPKTGEIRGWVWRWNWLHFLLVSRRNFQKGEPMTEERLALGVIVGMVDKAVDRRGTNWAPSTSSHVRRQHGKVREEHHIDWNELRLLCKQHDLNYDKLAAHIKRLAKEYRIRVR